MSETFEIASIEELQQWASQFIETIEAKTIVLLSGEVGAGKTETVKALVASLGGGDAFSPTYAIHNTYSTQRVEVDHVDLYRLEDDDDLESTGFWELFAKDNGLILIEWADRLDLSVYPKDWKCIQVKIRKKDGQCSAEASTGRKEDETREFLVVRSF